MSINPYRPIRGPYTRGAAPPVFGPYFFGPSGVALAAPLAASKAPRADEPTKSEQK